MTIRMDEGAAELLDTLHRAGYAAYVVGGCVRDSLLGCLLYTSPSPRDCS